MIDANEESERGDPELVLGRIPARSGQPAAEGSLAGLGGRVVVYTRMQPTCLKVPCPAFSGCGRETRLWDRRDS